MDKHVSHATLCRRTGVGYEIVCNLCEERVASEYAGETGGNLFCRGVDHVADAQKRAANKLLWKNILDKHERKLEISIFEHFSISRPGVFVMPQRWRSYFKPKSRNLYELQG